MILWLLIPWSLLTALLLTGLAWGFLRGLLARARNWWHRQRCKLCRTAIYCPSCDRRHPLSFWTMRCSSRDTETTAATPRGKRTS